MPAVAFTSAPPPGYGAPPPAIPVVVATRWRRLEGLATSLTVLFWLAVAAATFEIGVYVDRITVLNDLIGGDLGPGVVTRAHDSDHLVAVATAIMGLLSFVILVVMIVWTYRAAKNNEALGRLHPSLKPGWAIAGWLIPLADAVLPLLVLQDLWRGSEPSTPRQNPWWRTNPGSRLIGWYWAALLAGQLHFGRTTAHFSSVGELRGLRTHDVWAVAALASLIAAAVLGIKVVGRITARQEECLRAQQAAWAGTLPG